jgi:hypothetical protein
VRAVQAIDHQEIGPSLALVCASLPVAMHLRLVPARPPSESAVNATKLLVAGIALSLFVLILFFDCLSGSKTLLMYRHAPTKRLSW